MIVFSVDRCFLDCKATHKFHIKTRFRNNYFYSYNVDYLRMAVVKGAGYYD